MPEQQLTSPGTQRSDQLEEWIDRTIRAGHKGLEVAAEIVRRTQPGGTNAYEASPELLGNEAWFWPWNRAGFLYLNLKRPTDAATIFTCAYLAALRFQSTGQYRMHKGMPLCNVAYAFLSANQPEMAGVPALLGMVEDATTAGNPTETPSFQNLLAANTSELSARSLADFFLLLTRRRGLSPLYPESVLECVVRMNVLLSPEVAGFMQGIAAEFTPDTIGPALDRLREFWTRLQPIYARMTIPKVSEYGAISGAIPITGAYASGSRTAVPSPGPQARPGSRGNYPAPGGGDAASSAGE
jgi:hypothetical protein